MGAVIEIVSIDPAVRAEASRAFTRAPAEWSVRLLDEPSGEADVVVSDDEGAARHVVTFDPARPGDAVEEVEARLRPREPRSRTVLVAGAAGGVGTTTLALHLAAVWGRGTCVADLAGGAGRRLGMPDDARTWLPHDDDLAGAALPVAGGFRILCAPSPCAPAHFPFAGARASFDRLVLDAGTCRDVERAVEDADVAVLVTPPTRPGAEAARGVLAAHAETRWAVVTNRTGPGGQIMRRGLEARIGRPLALELPCCPALRDAEDEARLLEGRWHRWTRAVARLARAVDTC
ncbi:MAG: hypothetical protein M3323_06770 [Actinomycetota bacterium]|nr:hypothetical protein [Actinomycetota bacterium]